MVLPTAKCLLTASMNDSTTLAASLLLLPRE